MENNRNSFRHRLVAILTRSLNGRLLNTLGKTENKVVVFSHCIQQLICRSVICVKMDYKPVMKKVSSNQRAPQYLRS